VVFIKRGLSGIDVWARQIGQNSLDGVNPLRLVAEGIPDARGNLASMGLAVAASPVADGSDGSNWIRSDLSSWLTGRMRWPRADEFNAGGLQGRLDIHQA
jgi:hypothetical protein